MSVLGSVLCGGSVVRVLRALLHLTLWWLQEALLGHLQLNNFLRHFFLLLSCFRIVIECKFDEERAAIFSPLYTEHLPQCLVRCMCCVSTGHVVFGLMTDSSQRIKRVICSFAFVLMPSSSHLQVEWSSLYVQTSGQLCLWSCLMAFWFSVGKKKKKKRKLQIIQKKSLTQVSTLI